MRHLAFLAALALPFPALAQEEPPTPGSVVAAAQADEWKTIAPDDLLVMELAPDAAGKPREVVIQLLPPPFSQPWVENIRALARAHWWDGKSVYRVVDNWVAQWGGGDPEMDMDPGPLPEGVVSPLEAYETTNDAVTEVLMTATGQAAVERILAQGSSSPEFARKTTIRNSLKVDPYAQGTFFSMGWPVASAGRDLESEVWPVHCYASVGVARDLAPDTGTGSELYAVIGHAPRQLDRNIAVVGRAIEGIQHLSVLPRGTGDAGVYETRAEDTPILSVRLASEMTDPPAFEYLDTDSDSFARYVQVRANRKDSFYEVPAGGVDVCNVGVPIRRAGSQ